jgi:hypothetical protein
MESLDEYMEKYNKRLEEGIKNVELTDYDQIDFKRGSGYMHGKHEGRIEFIKDTTPPEELEEALFKEECQYIKALRESDKLAKSIDLEVDLKKGGVEEFLSNFK